MQRRSPAISPGKTADFRRSAPANNPPLRSANQPRNGRLRLPSNRSLKWLQKIKIPFRGAPGIAGTPARFLSPRLARSCCRPFSIAGAIFGKGAGFLCTSRLAERLDGQGDFDQASLIRPAGFPTFRRLVDQLPRRRSAAWRPSRRLAIGSQPGGLDGGGRLTAAWRPAGESRPGSCQAAGGLVACKRAKVIGPARSVPRDRQKGNRGGPLCRLSARSFARPCARPVKRWGGPGPRARPAERCGGKFGNWKRPDGGQRPRQK